MSKYLVKICQELLDFYKAMISPFIPSACRFYPSCSVYAKEAITKYGIFKGMLYSTIRILKCNPFGKGGYDPLPNDRRK
jgi:putative membrane protein insertion efficiency factor